MILADARAVIPQEVCSMYVYPQPKTNHSSDLAHYFLNGVQIYRRKLKKRKREKVGLQGAHTKVRVLTLQLPPGDEEDPSQA